MREPIEVLRRLSRDLLVESDGSGCVYDRSLSDSVEPMVSAHGPLITGIPSPVCRIDASSSGGDSFKGRIVGDATAVPAPELGEGRSD